MKDTKHTGCFETMTDAIQGHASEVGEMVSEILQAKLGDIYRHGIPAAVGAFSLAIACQTVARFLLAEQISGVRERLSPETLLERHNEFATACGAIFAMTLAAEFERQQDDNRTTH
jgi:hypothetical protein